MTVADGFMRLEIEARTCPCRLPVYELRLSSCGHTRRSIPHPDGSLHRATLTVEHTDGSQCFWFSDGFVWKRAA